MYAEEARLQEEARRKFKDHLLIVLVSVFIIATVKMVEHTFAISLSHHGLFPRNPDKLYGVLTMPFLHGDFDHLFANSFSAIVLGLLLFHFYEKVAWRVIICGWIFGGALLWCMGRANYHIGASGVIYTLSSFLFLSGVLRWRRDRRGVGAALVVSFLFGASVWGVLPLERGISWEGHLFGAIVGAFLAIYYRRLDLPPRYIDDPEEQDETVPDWYDDSWEDLDEDHRWE